MITGLILLSAMAILAWGWWRARPLGKLGLIAWGQSAVLMVPWLLLFGLIDVGVPINLVEILGVLVLAIATYIGLGRWLRQVAATMPPPLAPPINGTPTETTTNSTNEPQVGAVQPSPSPPKLDTRISDADVQAIQSIFGLNTFFATETIPYQEGLICKGNLRGEAATTHQHLTQALEARLPNQYRLFLVADQEAKPTVIILPRRNDPKTKPLQQWALAAVLLVATIATCLEISAVVRGFHLYEQPGRWLLALPMTLCLMSVLFSHELGHWLLARRYQVRLSLPLFLPTWQIGSFGALTRFETFLLNRQVRFDIALAGPAMGGVVGLSLLVLGLVLTRSGIGDISMPASLFQGSVLVGSLARAILGDTLLTETVKVNPLVLGGWLGLVITALNLMPAGILDGGRVVEAIYGRKVAGWLTFATLVLLAIAALATPVALYWAAVILLLQRDLDRPCLEEISEVDDTRATWGLLALFLMAATLIPLAPGLAGRLGIGTGY
jgi:Zn-dependent protease